MTTPRLLDSDGQPYAPELAWGGVKVAPDVVTQYKTVLQSEYDNLCRELAEANRELAALRRATKRETDGD